MESPTSSTHEEEHNESLSSEHDEDQTLPDVSERDNKRLIIQKMVLNNFKSYAGRREIGPFHKVCHPSIANFNHQLEFYVYCWS